MPRDAQGRYISSITGRIISDIPSSGGGGPSPGCRNGNCGGTCRGGPAPESSTQYNTRPTVNPDSLAKDDTNNYSEVLWETDTTNVYVAVLVRYPAVQKQNGLKVAVYKSDVFRNLDKKKLDLHFYDDKKSPVARFNANKDGVGFALDFIKKGQGDQKNVDIDVDKKVFEKMLSMYKQ